MSSPEVHEICDRLGEARLAEVVAAFYRRVPEDDVLGPMYPDGDFAGAETRLCSFLVYRFGGAADYLEQRGHPRLRIRHAPFPVTSQARDRWVQLMEAAVSECEIPREVADVMNQFFTATASFLMNSPGVRS